MAEDLFKVLVCGDYPHWLDVAPSWHTTDCTLDFQYTQQAAVLGLITSWDPDVIISVGETANQFPVLMNLSYCMRRRWLHTKVLADISSKGIQHCAKSHGANCTSFLGNIVHVTKDHGMLTVTTDRLEACFLKKFQASVSSVNNTSSGFVQITEQPSPPRLLIANTFETLQATEAQDPPRLLIANTFETLQAQATEAQDLEQHQARLKQQLQEVTEQLATTTEIIAKTKSALLEQSLLAFMEKPKLKQTPRAQ
jgi:hypothetical protein